MNNNIQCSIESSTTKIEFNSAVDGVFLVPELEGLAGLPEIRTTSGVNAGYDGGWTSAQNYDARLISIRGVIANPDVAQVEAKRRAIASLLGQGRKEQLTLRFTTEAGNSYVIYVRTISCEMALQRVLTTQEFLIQLRADDPLIYDDGASGGTEAILQVQKALGGFEINFELPLAIGGGAEDTIVENGAETAYPLINLYGPLHSPTVVNRTTNQQMQILADLQYTISWSDYTTESGSFITLNDVIQNAPMSLTQIKGNAEQTTYSGKNLMPMAVSDNTTDRYTAFYIGLPTGTYTISFDISNITLGSNTSFSPYMNLADGNGGSADVQLKGINSSTTAGRYYTTFTLNTAASVSSQSNIRIPQTQWDNGARVKISNIQIEAGSTATSYEPYVGGTASPNPGYPQSISTVTGAQTVGVTGKNLATLATSATKTVGGLNFTTDGGYININGTATSNANFYFDSFKLPTNDTATFSIDVSGYTDKPSSNSAVILQSSPDNSNWSSASTIWLLSGDPKSATITLDSSLYYRVRFYVTASSVFTNATIKVQLEKGSATTFEPYQGQSQTIDLGSIELAKIGTYQDYIWNDNGTWKVHKEVGKVVLDGSEAWLATTLTTGTRYFTIKNDIGLRSVNSNGSDIISNYFGGVSYVTYYQAGGVYGISHSNYQSNNYIQLFFAQSIGDSTAIATWLSTHNTTVYYALATPTDTAITQQSLIEQLEHIYQLYGGVNNISIMGTGNGSIEIRYATKKTITQDVVTIDSQARTITLNGQDIYHLKSEESEFLLLAPGDNKLYLTSEVSDDSGYAEVKFKQGYLSI